MMSGKIPNPNMRRGLSLFFRYCQVGVGRKPFIADILFFHPSEETKCEGVAASFEGVFKFVENLLTLTAGKVKAFNKIDGIFCGAKV
jgi:hypothetical protein